ncbi:MAG: hypothetical protein KGH73_12045 [Xanthomonadaceae bacterium]|nr:hypothetical protein [Xanthomonadaceae bacterium]
MTFQRVLLASALAFGVAGVAQADPVAMLYNVQGKVLVNQGRQFVPAHSGMALDTGDRVLLMDGAHAMVEYGSGCSLPLAPNSAATITARCLVSPENVNMMQAVGGGEPDQGNNDSNHKVVVPPPTNYTPALIIGGVVVVAAIAAGGGGGSSNPVSP